MEFTGLLAFLSRKKGGQRLRKLETGRKEGAAARERARLGERRGRKGRRVEARDGKWAGIRVF